MKEVLVRTLKSYPEYTGYDWSKHSQEQIERRAVDVAYSVWCKKHSGRSPHTHSQDPIEAFLAGYTLTPDWDIASEEWKTVWGSMDVKVKTMTGFCDKLGTFKITTVDGKQPTE